MMEFEIAESIVVRNPTLHLKQWCQSNLVLDNPDYYKKERMGKWTGNTPRTIQLYEQRGIAPNVLEYVLPFGCLNNLWATYHDEATFKPLFSCSKRVSYKSNINTYSYQEKAVEAILKAKNGVVVMPCGAGKTQTALEAVSRIGGKTLWLTHTQDLMNQSLNRAKAVLGADKSIYGTITGGKVNIGSGITFATIQTMCKLDIAKYRDEWDVIIVDECQHAIGSPTKVMQFYKVLSNLSARYKIGLTATPKRADGLEASMFALLGSIICEIDKEEVKHTTCPVEIRGIQTGYKPNYDCVLAGDGTINYAQLVEDLTNNDSRFGMVCQLVNSINEPTLVLANRVNYLNKLQGEYKGKSICLSTLGASIKAKQIRKESLQKLNSGEIDCIFATYQLAKEGLDVPNLRHLVLATPEKDETTVVQSVGRVGRKAEGKEVGVVWDLLDDFGMYKGWSKKRQKYYRKNSFSYIDI